MSKTKSRIPKFKNEQEERQFWESHDLTDYLDQLKLVKMDLSSLKPSTKTITLRLPASLLRDLKTLAHKKDVPYQSLTKIFLAERIMLEKQRLRSQT